MSGTTDAMAKWRLIIALAACVGMIAVFGSLTGAWS